MVTYSKSHQNYYQRNRERLLVLRAENEIKLAREYPERYLFMKVKHRAKREGIEFSITVDDIQIPKFCPVLGIKLGLLRDGQAKASTPSLDRKDNTKGYVPGNVSVISYRANQLKGEMSVGDVKRLLDYVSS